MARARRRNNQAAARETEKQFQDTFREMADAAGFHDQFHVVDTGITAQVRAVVADLRRRGLHEAAEMVARIGHNRVTSSGFPDWNLRHETEGILVAELKSDRRGANPTEEQIGWLRSFAISLRPPNNPYAPGRAHLWRPQHWPAIETQFGLVATPTYCHCEICEWLHEMGTIA